MNPNNNLNKILVIDFGSQFTQLIARRIRELGVFSEIVSHKIKFNKKIIELDIPILGICFGHQIISKIMGGKVKQSKFREFGLAKVKKKNNSLLVKNLTKKFKIICSTLCDKIKSIDERLKNIEAKDESKQ